VCVGPQSRVQGLAHGPHHSVMENYGALPVDGTGCESSPNAHPSYNWGPGALTALVAVEEAAYAGAR
jgi:hypothetical protein